MSLQNEMDALKEQIKELMEKRDMIEIEVEIANRRLEAAGVGMHAPLVDREVRPWKTGGSTTFS